MALAMRASFVSLSCLLAALPLPADADAVAWELHLEIDPQRAHVRGEARFDPAGRERATLVHAWETSEVEEAVLEPTRYEVRFIIDRSAGMVATPRCRDGARRLALGAPDALSLWSLVPRLIVGEQSAAPSRVLLTVPREYRVTTAGLVRDRVVGKLRHIELRPDEAAPLVLLRAPVVLSARAGEVEVTGLFSAQTGRGARGWVELTAKLFDALSHKLGPLPWRRLVIAEAPLPGTTRGLSAKGVVLLPAERLRQWSDPQAFLASLPPDAAATLSEDEVRVVLEDLLALTLAHEVAHQYFGAHVSSDGERHPVIDEAHAQYFGLVALEEVRGAAFARRLQQEQLVTAYRLHRARGGADSPADLPARAEAGPRAHPVMVYAKAPLLLDAQRRAAGDAAFFSAARSYLARYAGKDTCGTCFTELLAETAPQHAATLRSLHARFWEDASGDAELGVFGEGELCSEALSADAITRALVQVNCRGASASGGAR